MNLLRMTCIWASLLGALMGGLRVATAQTAYPQKPVKILVGFTPGGVPDIAARLLAQKWSEQWKQAVTVENRLGAGSNVAALALSQSPADGHTLLSISSAHAIAPAIYPKLAFDPQKDFIPISFITSAPIVLAANPDFPVNSVKELIALARRNPGQVSLATPGAGSPQDLASILFAEKAQIKFNSIPYKGNGPALVDILAGHVNIGMFTLSTVKEHAKTGKLKILAVISSKRTPLAPEIVSLTEAGLPDVEVSSRYLILAPAKTPKDIVLKLEKDFAKLAENKNYHSQLLNLGFEAISTSSAETTEILKKENSKWTPILKKLDISIQ